MCLDRDRLVAETFVAGVEHHAVLGSTNDHARDVAAAPPPLPWLMIADAQTAGRGRGTNTWWTGGGSLAASLLIDPAAWSIPRDRTPRIGLATAVAACDAVRPLLPPETTVGLHWPNDVYLTRRDEQGTPIERKLGGVLIEGLPGGLVVVGIGINTNNSLRDAPDDLRGIATSLVDLTGRSHDRTEFLIALMQGLERSLADLGRAPDAFGRRFDRLCLQRGRQLAVRSGSETIRGQCQGVAVDGALCLATETGPRRLYSGVVERDSGTALA